MTSSIDSSPRSSDSVRAVGRALDVLLAFTGDRSELTAAELLVRVELSRPTLYRLLYTLEAKGFLSSSGEPQRFRLGPAVARLSHGWTRSLDLAAVAEPTMRALWSETRETVAMFVPQGDLRLCLAEIPSPEALSFKRGVGYTERLVRGASGRAILAFMPAAERRLADYASELAIDAHTLRHTLAEVRERGYAVSRGELIAGAVAVAAPFFDRDGVAGSLGIFGPIARMGAAEVRVLGDRVVEAATLRLSAELGVPARAAS